MMNKLKHPYLKINSEYYVFLSGALISIPITLFLDIKENLLNVFFWISIFLSTATSLCCFMLSIRLTSIHENYEQAKKAYKKSEGGEISAWNNIVSDVDVKKKCISLFYAMLITLVISLISIIAMQFITDVSINCKQSIDCNTVSITETQ